MAGRCFQAFNELVHTNFAANYKGELFSSKEQYEKSKIEGKSGKI